MPLTIEESFLDTIRQSLFPCLGAKAAARKGQIYLGSYSDLQSPDQLGHLSADLLTFIRRHSEPRSDFAVHVALDTAISPADELDFESYLWSVLQRLNYVDGAGWDPRYSDDPEDPSFKFSFGGHAFYIIGFSPVASRRARYFPHPAIVFNPVWQFERLRELGQLDTLIDRIRLRDIAYEGSVNPNLRFEGSQSDSLQYSGRAVDSSWRCPFQPRSVTS
jgi:FPC/CPF motif-containing protein YcgG